MSRSLDLPASPNPAATNRMTEKSLRDRVKAPAFKASSVNMYMHDGTVDLRNVNGLLEDMAAEIRRLRMSKWIAVADQPPDQKEPVVYVRRKPGRGQRATVTPPLCDAGVGGDGASRGSAAPSSRGKRRRLFDQGCDSSGAKGYFMAAKSLTGRILSVCHSTGPVDTLLVCAEPGALA